MAAAYGGLDARSVSLRRLTVLLNRLPPGAGRAGGEAWSVTDHLLALVVDNLAYLTWVTLRANGAKNAPKPRPLPRPANGTGPASVRPAAARTAPESSQSPGWVRQLAAVPGVIVEMDDG